MLMIIVIDPSWAIASSLSVSDAYGLLALSYESKISNVSHNMHEKWLALTKTKRTKPLRNYISSIVIYMFMYFKQYLLIRLACNPPMAAD